ncbi:hypothetical protein SAMN05216391_11917 [Lachnospiraceae bacterium KHCPX20]|nr:hypothetical protein SAMN05216391_11917 [Lachnospiraceae bacterium KHCPX20]
MHNITIRLYRQYDLDLIALKRTIGFNFSGHAKAALISYITKKPYKFVAPEKEELKPGYIPSVMRLQLQLNNKEWEIINAGLKQIRDGYKNAFIKAVIRKSMEGFVFDIYRDRKDLIFAKEEDYLEEPTEKYREKKQKPQETIQREQKLEKDEKKEPKKIDQTEQSKFANTSDLHDETFYEDDTGGLEDDIAKMIQGMSAIAHN